MEALFLCLGAVVGAAVAWSLAMRKAHAAETRAVRAEEGVRARDASLDALRREMDERTASMDRAFAQASEKALNEATARFLAMAKGQFDGRAAEEQAAIRALLDPMHKELDALERLTHEAGRDNASRLGELKGQIESVSRASESLANALKKPAVRGSWGEGQLVAILEGSGLVAGKSFVVQDQTDREGKLLRTDVVIALPRGRRIVIDSKAPLDGYLAAVEATTDEERLRRCQDHARAVRGHVRDLQKKEYWSRYEGSPEYVILFLPYEAAYQIACEHDKALMDDAQRSRIILANPMTLMNLVHLATYVLNEERLQENAEQVRAHAKALCDRLGRAVDLIGRHGRHLRLAAESYNELVGSVGSRLLPSANRMRDLGAGGERPIEPPETMDTMIRPLVVPELSPEATG